MSKDFTTATETTKATTASTDKVESEYTAEELAAASETIFGKRVMPECVIAAFKIAKIKKATMKEAKTIVSNFLHKEVKG